MSVKIHPLARGMAVTADEVRLVRQAREVPLMEAKAIAQNHAFHDRISDLRYGDHTTEEKIDGLLDLIGGSLSSEDL